MPKPQEVYKNVPSDSIQYSESFQPEVKITGSTFTTANCKDAKIAISLKFLTNFCRTLKNTFD